MKKGTLNDIIELIGDNLVKPLLWGKDHLRDFDEWELKDTIKKIENGEYDKEDFREFSIDNWRIDGVYNCPICTKEYSDIIEDLRKNNLRPSKYILEHYEDSIFKRCIIHKEGEDKIGRFIYNRIWRIINRITSIPDDIENIVYRLKNGFWYYETWNFDREFYKWAYPRFKKLKKQGVGIIRQEDKDKFRNPDNDEEFKSMEEYQDFVLEKIRWALWFGNYEHNEHAHECEWEKFDEGMMLFGKYVRGLND